MNHLKNYKVFESDELFDFFSKPTKKIRPSIDISSSNEDINSIKDDIDEMVDREHTSIEIREFIRNCVGRINELPPGKDKEQIKAYLLNKTYSFPIKKFKRDNDRIFDIIPNG